MHPAYQQIIGLGPDAPPLILRELVVPTYSDDPETVRRLCGWLIENLGPDYPLHFLFPAGARSPSGI